MLPTSPVPPATVRAAPASSATPPRALRPTPPPPPPLSPVILSPCLLAAASILQLQHYDQTPSLHTSLVHRSEQLRQQHGHRPQQAATPPSPSAVLSLCTSLTADATTTTAYAGECDAGLAARMFSGLGCCGLPLDSLYDVLAHQSACSHKTAGEANVAEHHQQTREEEGAVRVLSDQVLSHPDSGLSTSPSSFNL
ncbi:hypothetical protein HK405_008579 [Cladochytrium tenue]|nr:hypothetical protein HK405_008579 [Cladochytrium tenue]